VVAVPNAVVHVGAVVVEAEVAPVGDMEGVNSRASRMLQSIEEYY
jgi:hypothetical protein